MTGHVGPVETLTQGDSTEPRTGLVPSNAHGEPHKMAAPDLTSLPPTEEPVLPKPGPCQRPVPQEQVGGIAQCGPAYLNHVVHDVHVEAFAVTTGAPDPPQVL